MFNNTTNPRTSGRGFSHPNEHLSVIVSCVVSSPHKTVKIILDLPKILWGVHTLSEHIIVLKKMSSGIAVGLKKGFPVEKREKIVRPSNKKAVSLSNYILIIFSPKKIISINRILIYFRSPPREPR